MCNLDKFSQAIYEFSTTDTSHAGILFTEQSLHLYRTADVQMQKQVIYPPPPHEEDILFSMVFFPPKRS